MPATHAELLAAHIDVNFSLAVDARPPVYRLADGPVLAAVAWSPRAHILAAGDISFGVAQELPTPYASDLVPPSLLAIADRLALNDCRVRGGPSWLFPTGISVRQDPDLLVSGPAGRQRAKRLLRPGNWEPDEWAELIGGTAGPWAMAIAANEPVAICHTPVANAYAAEAGVWTRTDHRGRGLAGAVTEAWAGNARTDYRFLFYSTTTDNLASRSVAHKLGLLRLGALWSLHPLAGEPP